MMHRAKRPLPIETVFSAVSGAASSRAWRHAGSRMPGRIGALADVRTIVLIGMAGRRGWDAFAASPEAHDGLDHPLDRFSRRVIDALAQNLGAAALYSFGGPPYWPFQQWARRCRTRPSVADRPPHPSALRSLALLIVGRLGFARSLDVPAWEATPSPCETCAEKPCLGACPVGAFSSAATMSRLRGASESAAGSDCMDYGCLARRACPVGAEHAHGPAQAAFTMRAFLRAREPELS